MAYARICAMALCALTFFFVFSSGAVTTQCDNSTCIRGDCERDLSSDSTSFRCECHANWFGDNCTEFICDHAEEYPCRNNGTCYQQNDTSFGCSCDNQYSGDRCEISHFNCTNASCNGYGSCSDSASLPSGYQCDCEAGFTGDDCEIDIDDCEGVNCNSGTCVDGINTYVCECNVNYTGPHCNHPDYCAIHSAEESFGCIDGVCCANGGTCYNNLTTGRHECECVSPWLSFYGCRRPAQPCAADPCQNNGTCIPDGYNYTCHCISIDFTGDNCEIEIVHCANNTCLNNGTCVAKLTSGGEETGQHCRCHPYYTGDRCETPFDPCANKCQNNGTCQSNYISDGDYDTVCSCTEYFTGENCSSDINECSLSNICLNGGKCENLVGSFNCTCQEGFTGERCETNIDDCINVTCRNNGTCLDLVNDFECSCIPQYSGKLCQWYYNQTCNGSLRGCVDAHTINCTDNYEGIVSNTEGNGFKCSCVEGFIGERCEAKVLQCQDNMVCGGLDRKLDCIEGEHVNDYQCVCRFGYAGDRCEIDIDLCENSPCQNGGTCQDNGNNYTCNCTAGYSGHNCSTVLCDNPDISVTCIMNQTVDCADTPSGPMCTCHPGFTGVRCETIYNACDSSPCHSMATCQPHGNDYSCTCPEGYSGRQCTMCAMSFCNCPVDDCDIKAGNGKCDEECRTEACHWDKDECGVGSLPSNIPTIVPKDPWSDCGRTVCRDRFNDGSCDSQCAGPDCLLDGGDCLQNRTCPFKEECELLYQNGECDKQCIGEACQFDGGDCEETEERRIVSGLLVIILVLPAGQEFTGTLRGEFLIALGDILNCIPILKDANKIETPSGGQSRVERQSSNNVTSWNITVSLDITHCEYNCISNAEEASDIVEVHSSRRSFPPEGYTAYSYSVDEDNEPEDPDIPVLYIAIPAGAVVLVILVLGVVVGVKRRRATGTWHPNDKRNSRADGERDTPSPSRRRSTMGDPVGQEETISLKSIRDEDVEFGDSVALKKARRGPKYAWADVESKLTNVLDKKHPGKEAYIGQETEDTRTWANLQYNDMRDYSRLKTALQLMEQKTNADGRHRDINAKGPGGHTPLMMAVMQTSVAVMRGSLESKEEPMPEGAVANACVSIKDLLVMKADVNAKNDRGQTTLHIATACCTSDAVRQLVEAGSDVNAQDIDGWTPLHVAVGAVAHNVFRILLYHKGVNIDAQDRNGMTPLILASKDCAVTMAKQLLDRQAEPGIADHKGKTALHWAAAVNNVDGIRLLLHSNANKDVQDHRGQSPLFLAAREGHIEAVRLLLECFANRNIVDNMDRSPMMIAEERKHSAVARMLGEWNITALSHDGAVAQALAHAGHMATTMASPSVVRRRQPADSFFASQIDTPHPNIPQPPCEVFCPVGNGNGHLKMEYPSLDYHQCISGDMGSSAPSTTIPPSVSLHDQLTLTHQATMPQCSNGHTVPSISVENVLPPHIMASSYSPSGNVASLAVTRVNSSSSGSPASVLSPSNTSPLTHIDEPIMPVTSSYPTNTNVSQAVSSYQRDSTGNESLGSDNNILLAENTSFPTPPSALGCDAVYPYSPLASAADSVYLTPPPDPESPERWLSSPGKGKSPNINDLSKRPMTNLPHGLLTEPPPPYRPPYPSEMAYTITGQ